MSTNASFGQWLKERRKALDLTQAALAKNVGCTLVTVQKVEANGRRPSRSLAERLAQYLGVPEAKYAAFIQFARGLSPNTTVWENSFQSPINSNVPTTRLIGRDQEIETLGTHLFSRDVRLLTLVGPGGMGKTRLAIEVAQRLPFRDRVQFVSLQSLASSDFLVAAIADALGFQFYRGSNPARQLLDYLHEKSLLLVLDNFEHLMPGVELIAEIIHHARGVRMLITSRERLNLNEEWVLDLGGLTYPSNEQDPNSERYGAVELFMQCARRVNISFHLTDAQRPAVVRICRLVGGMPLGIELAATWVRALSCEAIALEIERSLDILETPARNIDPRHRTIRAAFEPTWRRLSDEERQVFMRLSVFRGGFTREAAEVVAGASLRSLSALVDQSLLRMDAAGRYDVHELLRQYGKEQLLESEEVERVGNAHCAYYARLVAETNDVATWGARNEIEQLEPELDNLRLAYDYAIETRQLNALEDFLWSLKLLHHERGWYQQMEELAHRAIESLQRGLDPADVQQLTLLGGYLNTQATAVFYLGRMDEARTLAQASLAVLLPLEAKRELCHTYYMLHYFTISPIERKEFLGKAVTLAKAINYGYAMAAYSAKLGWAAYKLDQYEEAGQLANEALVLAQQRGFFHVQADANRLLGAVALQRQHYSMAKQRIRQALRLDTETRFWLGVESHELLGHIALTERNDLEAIQHFQAMLATAKDLGIPPQRVKALNGLERAACRLGLHQESHVRLLEALQIAEGLHDAALLLDSLEAAAEWLALEGRYERSFQLVSLVLHHPQSDWKTRRQAEQFCDERKASFASYGLGVVREHVGRMTLAALVQTVIAELIEPNGETGNTLLTSTQPLLLPGLTERELEILRLIAEGNTNQEIAARLYIGVSTVKKHINHLYDKLDAKNRTQAVTHARDRQLLIR